MKLILLCVTIVISSDLAGQLLRGKINYTRNNPISTIIWVTATDINQPKSKPLSVKTDSLGYFDLSVNKSSEYQLSISGAYEPDTTFNVILKKDATVEIKFDYPPKICPYERTKLTGICPTGNHKNNVIPIVYGLIMGSKSFFRKVEKGKIELGGCMVTDCDPNWYCKTHDRRF